MSLPKSILKSFIPLSYDKDIGAFKCYNKSHQREVYIQRISRHDIDSYTELGWDVLPLRSKKDFVVRSPEVVLCDLTEPWRNPCLMNQAIQWYNLLEDNLDKLTGLVSNERQEIEIRSIKGPSLEAQIRVATRKKDDDLSRMLYDISLKECLLKENKQNLREPIISNVRLADCKKAEGLITKLRNEYKIFTQKIFKDFTGYLKLKVFDDNVQVPIGFWKDVYDSVSADKYIFILSSGLKYAAGFIEETGCFDVDFWENHNSLNNPSNKFKMGNLDLQKKVVCVIDSVYSGRTLRKVKQEVIGFGGKPILVGLFPKSRLGLMDMDYSVIIDKLLTYGEVSPYIGSSFWAKVLYKKVLSPS